VLVGGYGIGAAAGTLLGGVLADRWGRRGTLLLAHYEAAILLAPLILVTPVPAVAAIVAVVGLFQGMPGPAFVAATIISELAPPAIRARYRAVFYLTFSVAVSSLQPWAASTSSTWATGTGWPVAASAPLAALGHLLASRPRERRVAGARAVPRTSRTPDQPYPGPQWLDPPSRPPTRVRQSPLE
jgi:MFS family permease